ncbi:MAG: tRNA threonylcarbamoyladenosine dehydratase [Bacilli bacterium]
MLHRFSRTELVIGPEGLDILRRAAVAVLGMGGVGSYTVEALARSGIGRLLLVDKDVVDITNINRQIPALTSTVGRPKVDVMAERVAAINPECVVETKRMFFMEDTADDIFSNRLDYVADAIDTVSAKIQLIRQCKARNIPIVSSMGAANKIDPTQFRVMDISETAVDPIARVIRRELRKYGIVNGLTVVCSLEEPRPPREDVRRTVASDDPDLPRKATHPPASIAFVPPVAGLLLASVIVRELVGM